MLNSVPQFRALHGGAWRKPLLGISLKTLYNKLHKYEDERQQRAG